MNDFAERLKKFREDRDWSRAEVAKMMGTTRVMIYRYEEGITTPSADKVVKLADIYKVSLDDIFLPANVPVSKR